MLKTFLKEKKEEEIKLKQENIRKTKAECECLHLTTRSLQNKIYHSKCLLATSFGICYYVLTTNVSNVYLFITSLSTLIIQLEFRSTENGLFI